MMRMTFIIGLAATLAALLCTSQAQAWGAAHVGYTHVGYGGVQHYGRTTAVGPYGSYSGAHYGSYGAGGSYHAGYGAGSSYGGYVSGGAYRYGGVSSYGGYHYGGVGVTPVHNPYASGYYRAW